MSGAGGSGAGGGAGAAAEMAALEVVNERLGREVAELREASNMWREQHEEAVSRRAELMQQFSEQGVVTIAPKVEAARIDELREPSYCPPGSRSAYSLRETVAHARRQALTAVRRPDQSVSWGSCGGRVVPALAC